MVILNSLFSSTRSKGWWDCFEEVEITDVAASQRERRLGRYIIWRGAKMGNMTRRSRRAMIIYYSHSWEFEFGYESGSGDVAG